MNRFYLGIDISKKFLAVALLDAEDRILWRNEKISNNSDGFKKLIKKAVEVAGKASKDSPFEIAVGAESTGVYGEKLCCFLHAHRDEDNRFTTYILNPMSVRYSAKASGNGTKNDAVDSIAIASYLSEVIRKGKVLPWIPPTAEEEHLRALSRRRDELVHLRTQELNRLEKNENAAVPDCYVGQSVKGLVAYLDEEIEALEGEIEKHIDQTPGHKESNKLLQSIPGVGPILASMFLAEIGNLSRFRNAKQLVAFIGLAVVEWTSGSSVHKRPRINKRGRGRLRGCLYMAAMSAIRCNPVIRAFYERLRSREKARMVALIAAMKKLVHIMFGVLKNQNVFDPAYAMRMVAPA